MNISREGSIRPPFRGRINKIHLNGGITLHYAEQGDVGGPVILFLHGFVDSWHSFESVLPLIPKEYHAYALDQRGHGNSSKPQSSYEISDFADDIESFMNAQDIKKAILVGHSMGGLIAQQVALATQEAVSHLILLGTSAKPVNDDLLEFSEDVAKLNDPVDAEFIRDFQLSTIQQELPEGFLETLLAESGKPPAHVWRAALTGLLAYDARAGLRQLNTPTLVLWGDQDKVFLKKDQDLLRSLISNITFRTYKQTGHALHWERPSKVAQDIIRFIN